VLDWQAKGQRKKSQQHLGKASLRAIQSQDAVAEAENNKARNTLRPE
jgi:hypothetical protein